MQRPVDCLNRFKRALLAIGMVAAGTVCLTGGVAAQGIYSCTDAKGRRITADRPIAECTDREQKELTPWGSVKRIIGPSLTALERAAQEEREKVALELKAFLLEEKRRDRALLVRYPSRQVHDKERSDALAQIDEVIKASDYRAIELADQRRVVDAELEFYREDPSRAPAALRRRLDSNETSLGVQKRFLIQQELERKRVTARFDEELLKLDPLWEQISPSPDKANASARSGPRR